MSYCTALLLPGERKSVEPMAARLAPDNVRRTDQLLHHVVADAPWSDQAVLWRVNSVLPAMQGYGNIVCWIVDDTRFPKKGICVVYYAGPLFPHETCNGTHDPSGHCFRAPQHRQVGTVGLRFPIAP